MAVACPLPRTADTTPKPSNPLCKLPPELVEMIFAFALRCDAPMAFADKGDCNDIALLLALNNDVYYGEAHDIFYNCNTFRLNEYQQFSDLTTDLGGRPASLITSLQLRNFWDKDFVGGYDFNQIFEVCSQMPALRSLEVSYDALKETLSLRHHMIQVDEALAQKLVSVGVGLYKLQYNKKLTVHFKHYAIVQTWQAMKRAGSWDFATVVNDFIASSEYGTAEALRRLRIEYREQVAQAVNWHVNSLSLHEWAACFDEFHRRKAGGEVVWNSLSWLEDMVLDKFPYWHFNFSEELSGCVSAGTRFCDLDETATATENLDGLNDLLLTHAMFRAFEFERRQSRHYQRVRRTPKPPLRKDAKAPDLRGEH
ncbi:hypothetical protein LTR56_022211 [Elasticomyces elasticus]|nr:hypothetical protein LTR56_022211 [Elasticomyces elasticus]KAK3632401.1 hypothetical protein LTR22_020586 [Elasticomyces elasticus]KAK4917256.1 hypothetical protein LTR49_014877 [Elasticomyces elasticus]KAK5749604.1 hypothetical protein LTS12_020314 [Elasticomyces elasticus]